MHDIHSSLAYWHLKLVFNFEKWSAIVSQLLYCTAKPDVAREAYCEAFVR
jgi:hypothetical protein